MTDRPHRRVRSFVRRPGRITTGQRRAVEQLLPRYGIADRDGPIDLDRVFGRRTRRVLDIGFGDGEALIATAARYPEIDYLGVEVHEPGIGHLLVLLERAGLGNVRVIAQDAVDLIADRLEDESFDAVNLFFPDPWPKKRHHKRRIVQPDFVRNVARILRPGGLFHVATDWADYGEHVVETLARAPQFVSIAADAADAALVFRPPTKFHNRGLRLGHTVTDFYYRRT